MLCSVEGIKRTNQAVRRTTRMKLIDIQIDVQTLEAWETQLAFAINGPDMEHPSGYPYIQLDGITISFAKNSCLPKGSILSWSFTLDDASNQTVDFLGIPTRILPSQNPSSSRMHPNGIKSIDHIVLKTTSVSHVMDAFKRFNQVPKRHGTIPGGVRLGQTFAFYKTGNTVIEVVGPEKHTQDPGEPTQETKCELWGITFNSSDLPSTYSVLNAVAKNQIRNAVQKGRQIFTVNMGRAGLGACQVAVMSIAPKQNL